MFTTEEARVKGEERMLCVTPIFCDEEEKVQNFTMNRMPPPLEGKVTFTVASRSLYTHKKSTGEYKERMGTCPAIWHSAGFRLVCPSVQEWRFSFINESEDILLAFTKLNLITLQYHPDNNHNTINLMIVDSIIPCFIISTVLLPALPLWILRRSHDVGRAGMMAILQMRKLQSREVKWGPERPSHKSNFLQQPGRYHKCVSKLAIIKHGVMGPEAKAEATWPTRKHS